LGRPNVAGFGWTILLALAISLVCLVVVQWDVTFSPW
jgi:hypothetical protein